MRNPFVNAKILEEGVRPKMANGDATKRWQFYLLFLAVLFSVGWNIYKDRLSVETTGADVSVRVNRLEKDLQKLDLDAVRVRELEPRLRAIEVEVQKLAVAQEKNQELLQKILLDLRRR